MAETTLQAESVCENPLSKIEGIAHDIQREGEQLRHLLTVIEDAQDSWPPFASDAERENFSRIMAFAEIAKGLSTLIVGRAETVESLAMDARRK